MLQMRTSADGRAEQDVHGGRGRLKTEGDEATAYENVREREGSVSHPGCGSKRALSQRPSEESRIKAIGCPPTPLITFSLLSPPLKCCQFTSLLSFSDELSFCYIKTQWSSTFSLIIFGCCVGFLWRVADCCWRSLNIMGQR